LVGEGVGGGGRGEEKKKIAYVHLFPIPSFVSACVHSNKDASYVKDSSILY